MVKRITIISAAVFPQKNGAAVIFHNLVNTLSANGLLLTLHVPFNAEVNKLDNLTIHYYKAKKYLPFNNIYYPYHISNIKDDSDIIHIITNGPWEYFLAKKIKNDKSKILLSYLTDYSYIPNSIGYLKPFNKILKLIWKKFERNFFNLSHGVHFLNNKTPLRLKLKNDKEVFVIPPGVTIYNNQYECNNIIPSFLNLKKKYKLIGYVGRLSDEKAPEKILDVLLWHKHYFAIIIGNGPNLKKIQKIIKKNRLESRCLLINELDQKTLHLYMRSFDFLLLPSKSEQFGLIALEAISLSIPVISFDYLEGPSYINEVITKNIFLLSAWEKNHFNELENKISELIFDTDFDLSAYSWDHMGSNMLNAYKAIIRN